MTLRLVQLNFQPKLKNEIGLLLDTNQVIVGWIQTYCIRSARIIVRLSLISIVFIIIPALPCADRPPVTPPLTPRESVSRKRFESHSITRGASEAATQRGGRTRVVSLVSKSLEGADATLAEVDAKGAVETAPAEVDAKGAIEIAPAEVDVKGAVEAAPAEVDAKGAKAAPL